LRTSRNALKHGLRAHQVALLDDENATELAALDAAVRAELAPAGMLQADLARRSAPTTEVGAGSQARGS
jgi:hypothetical protein